MRKDKRGITLIEILISISISAVVSLLIAQFFFSTIRYSKTISSHLDATYYGKKIVSIIKQELHRNTASATGEYPVHLANNYEIVFFTKLPNFTQTAKVRYWLEDRTLYKSITPFSEETTSYQPEDAVTQTIMTNCANIEADIPLFLFYSREVDIHNTEPLAVPAIQTSIGLVQTTLLLDPENLPEEEYITHTNQVRLIL